MKVLNSVKHPCHILGSNRLFEVALEYAHKIEYHEHMEDRESSLTNTILKAKSGDRSAFDTLYRMYITPVYRYVFIRVRNKEDTEDIVQDTFLKAFEAIERYQDEKPSMLPYFFTIARNLLINHGKKKRPDGYLPEEIDRHASDLVTSGPSTDRELSEDLHTLMEVLTETEREVIELRFFGEQTYTEIALTLKKREDAVRQHVARALKKMKLAMEERDRTRASTQT